MSTVKILTDVKLSMYFECARPRRRGKWHQRNTNISLKNYISNVQLFHCSSNTYKEVTKPIQVLVQGPTLYLY